ncbi:hypothetical protein PRIC2_010984 [Phytophthora ramorum]
MAEELQHLSRFEKKRLVKSWHATQVTSSDSTPSLYGGATDSERMTSAGSLRSLFGTPLGASAYESQPTGTWRSIEIDHEGLQSHERDEKLPQTVGQVKHAYRARARDQEARETTNAIRKRERILELRRGPQWRDQLSKSKAQNQQSTAAESHDEKVTEVDVEHEEAAVSPQNEFEQELQLIDLPVDEVMTNAAYRDEVLRRIRHQLSNGGQVVLQSACFPSKESVSNTRLMLQTLCTQSLAYCTRDQDVVPNQPQPTRLILHLLPRVPFKM